jgi:hypothetical protein
MVLYSPSTSIFPKSSKSLNPPTTMRSLIAMVFLALKTVLGQSGRPCGLKVAPCPEDQHCIPNEPGCDDPNRCIGHCEFTNTYPSCGGHRAEPLDCDASADCRDDPREPDSCGMACDIPGICIPKDHATCDPSQGMGSCPGGLFCYVWEEEKEFDAGNGCGICL